MVRQSQRADTAATAEYRMSESEEVAALAYVTEFEFSIAPSTSAASPASAPLFSRAIVTIA